MTIQLNSCSPMGVSIDMDIKATRELPTVRVSSEQPLSAVDQSTVDLRGVKPVQLGPRGNMPKNVEAWRTFGTIGYDNYLQWVLDTDAATWTLGRNKRSNA